MAAILTTTDVLDDAEVASLLEQQERDSSIRAILKDKPTNLNRDIEKLIDPEKECDDCGAIIPIERQRVVLTISETCDYCVACQEIIAKELKLYNKEQKLYGRI
jgi:RNA polymerase-binding transcription factor DksA